MDFRVINFFENMKIDTKEENKMTKKSTESPRTVKEEQKSNSSVSELKAGKYRMIVAFSMSTRLMRNACQRYFP